MDDRKPHERDILNLIADRKIHRHRDFKAIMIAHGFHGPSASHTLKNLIKEGLVAPYAYQGGNRYGLPGLIEAEDADEEPFGNTPSAGTIQCPHCQGRGRIRIEDIQVQREPDVSFEFPPIEEEAEEEVKPDPYAHLK